jgi:hypothetical protein
MWVPFTWDATYMRCNIYGMEFVWDYSMVCRGEGVDNGLVCAQWASLLVLLQKELLMSERVGRILLLEFALCMHHA